jgi:flavin reductase (DIM6/NTAB) family NADH-FMN oxidoreductase RutF
MFATFSQLQLRHALGAFATGVTIVSSRVDDRDIGLTVNSFASVSLSPPLILWSLARHSGNVAAFERVEHFAVHVLGTSQQHLAERFAYDPGDRFAGLDVERGPDDIPLLGDCAARFVCRITSRIDGGDHRIYLGEVLSLQTSERDPLLYLHGRYSTAVPLPDAGPADDEAPSLGRAEPD